MNAAEALSILERVKSWPVELQVQLAEVAEMIEANNSEPDEIDDETRAAIEEGRAELERGEVVTEADFMDLFSKYHK